MKCFRFTWNMRPNSMTRSNYDDIFHQFANVVKYMRDPKTGLYYHGYDASKKAFWCDKETGLSQNFWLRALLVFHGIVRHLEQM